MEIRRSRRYNVSMRLITFSARVALLAGGIGAGLTVALLTLSTF